MKKFLALIISACLIIGITGCQSNTSKKPDTSVQDTQKTETKQDATKQDNNVPAKGKVKISVWGVNLLAVGSGNKEMVDAFNKTHNNIEIVAQSNPSAPGYETQDLTKLTAAIAAGNAPDVSVLNAPFIMEVASRDVLEPLDQYIIAAHFDMKDFYDYTVKEMTFNGKVWGIPNGVDTRFLYYNKKKFKEAGLDPEKPPKTWDELLQYSEKLTKRNSNGEFTQIGFIPNYGNSWLYLYMLQNGGRMVSDDGKTATLNSDKNIKALDFMVKGYDLLGGATKVNAYVEALNKQTGANDPLLTGKVAMVINGNWAIGTYARYGKDIINDIGFTYAPTPTGSDFITWSGGWSYGMPKGCKNPKEAFEVMTWLATDGAIEQSKGISKFNKKEGYLDIPAICASKSTNEKLFKTYVDPMENKHVKDMLYFGMDILDISFALPAHPCGQFIWAEHARAIDNAIYKKMTPEQALNEANTKTQAEIDKFWSSYKPAN